MILAAEMSESFRNIFGILQSTQLLRYTPIRMTPKEAFDQITSE